jgi:hypothetical protein
MLTLSVPCISVLLHQFINRQLHVNVTFIVTSRVKIKSKVKSLTCFSVWVFDVGDLTFNLVLTLDVTLVCVCWLMT